MIAEVRAQKGFLQSKNLSNRATYQKRDTHRVGVKETHIHATHERERWLANIILLTHDNDLIMYSSQSYVH